MSDENLPSAVEGMTDDDLMKFTQGTRKRFIEHITLKGFPEDTKEQAILLAALSDMDRTALGNKRIGANERQAAADALVARAISQITDQFGSRNPFEGERRGEIPVYDPTKLPEASPVPGETDIGLSEQTYKDMASKFDD